MDHGDWALSLLVELLGRLYRLITWQGGFNSKPRPVYFEMCRITLWVELLGWVCASTPFIRWRFGLAPGACARGLCPGLAPGACARGLRPGLAYILFSTPLVAP